MKFRFVAAFVAAAVSVAALGYVGWSSKDEVDPDSVGPWAKPIAGDYWAHRVAYPTMNFSPAWYEEAKPADKRMASRVPAGDKRYQRSAQSPLSLTPNGWTFLGPSPLLNGGAIVSGRTNVIAVDPSGPDIDGKHTVFAASDGGGLWKSTNCCSATTSWRNVTADRAISSTAIGEIYI